MALSSLVFLTMPHYRSSTLATSTSMVLTILLAYPEKLASIAGTVSIEGDWGVVICQGKDARRRQLNSILRRIDLVSKLLAPVCISALGPLSVPLAIWTMLGLNTLALPLEYLAIAQVRSLPLAVLAAADGPRSILP